jgi:hypothetical protein
MGCYRHHSFCISDDLHLYRSKEQLSSRQYSDPEAGEISFTPVQLLIIFAFPATSCSLLASSSLLTWTPMRNKPNLRLIGGHPHWKQHRHCFNPSSSLFRRCGLVNRFRIALPLPVRYLPRARSPFSCIGFFTVLIHKDS